MSEPFLCGNASCDTACPPTEGWSGHDPLHTWVFAGVLDGRLGFLNSCFFQSNEVNAGVKSIAGLVRIAGFESNVALRKVLVASVADGERARGCPMLHAAAGDKLLAWLERSISAQMHKEEEAIATPGAESEDRRDMYRRVRVHTRVLACVAACCDPQGREC